ncbi:hypothetical protein DH2020_035656 [Rehmannia glutinosa]|uniref:AT-hook motif nuclear-localized protein n=1 Tax=Rehmannia glutinosa TaxID=99300 RepID=A0ABR0V640_REHGL
MSGVSETAAVMASREPFTVNPTVSPQNPAASQSQLDQQMRVSYTADGAYRSVGSPPPYQSITGGTPVMKPAMNLNSGDQKRKRGRPRKYGPDGNMAMVMASPQAQQPMSDVSSKIMAFSQNGPRAVCILSANGAISNVTLRQAATSGGTATYEGRFDILSLSGSFMLSDVGGQRSRTGGLSTTLAGRMEGFSVVVWLVIVGSFIADGQKEPKSANYMEHHSGQPKVNMGGATGGSSSPSRGTFSESSGGPASPLNLSSGACNNNHPQGMSAMPWK